MQQVLFKGKSYDVQLPELTQPLVLLPGCGTELIHPLDCLRLGVFCNSYFNSLRSYQVHSMPLSAAKVLNCYFTQTEIALLPECYKVAELCSGTETDTNYFKVSAGSSYEAWAANGWIQKSSSEGWFEAYVQAVTSNNFVNPPGYLTGNTDFATEQKRVLSFVARHSAQLKASAGDLTKRKRQRQALLQWASPLAFL